ncbi:MAG: class I SAM-dependent methyltransferase [Candidatus Marinimicrobia bacterium]|nr:class I SAM-dependent methyltransferase [Candidatus Neomarinimicrobiota bacterium]
MTESFEIINCPVCGSEKQDLYLKTFDRFDRDRKDKFEIVQCSNCQFIFLNPRPTLESLDRHYAVEGYDPFISADEKQSLRDKFYLALRKFNLSVKHRKIKKFKSTPGKILDIGCATGEFLAYYKQYYWQCTGVEVDAGARDLAREKNIKVFSSVHEIPDQEKFDVITLWHVLEHVHDLNKSIEKIKKMMNKDGVLVIAVPNILSCDSQKYGKNWVALDTPRHLYHYTVETIQRLFSKYHMNLVRKDTLMLDILYNNLLSKQLAKTSFFPFIRILFLSLFKTYILSSKYSSTLVYYFKKEENHE